MATADDDCSDYSDGECCRAFQRYVELEQAKTLPEAEKKEGKGTAVRKAIKDGLKEPGLVTACEASIMPKYQDKKTKKIKDVDFVTKILPELAAMKLSSKSKGKKPSEEECKKEEKRMRKNLCTSVKVGKEKPMSTVGKIKLRPLPKYDEDDEYLPHGLSGLGHQLFIPPESKGGTKADKVTDRLTDTSKYTGAHKERFDESGKGKGIKGREDKADNSGYVGNYKGEGTYDKK